MDCYSWIKDSFGAIKNTTTVIGDISTNNRSNALIKKLREFSRARIVVTDRLHAMVFAAITGTPCVAFDNSSKKVSGVYEWIKYLDYITVVDNYSDAKVNIELLINKGANRYEAPSFLTLEKSLFSYITNK